MAGTYGGYTSPTVKELKGFLVRPEYSLTFGGIVGVTYPVAGVPVNSAFGRNLGLVDAFGFSVNTTLNPVTGSNVLESGLYELTAEETTIQLTLKEWDLDVIESCLLNGEGHSLMSGAERLMTWGGGSKVEYNPLVLNMVNASINAPTSQNIANGITGMIATFYQVICTSTLNFDQLQANEDKPLALEFRAVRDHSLARGNQTGNLYFY